MSGSAWITGVVAALPAEARCLLDQQSSGREPGRALLVRVSGIGGVRAAYGAQQLLEAGAVALLCFGVGGALDPALRCGDIVLASEVIAQPADSRTAACAQAVQSRVATHPAWRQTLAARLSSLAGIHVGPLLSSETLVSSAQRKQELFAASGALAVDMESAAVARAAQRHAVPFMALRVIADTAQDSLPSVLQRTLGRDAALPYGARFWWSLLSTPSSWPGLARLGRRYRTACGVLARCGHAGIAAPPPAGVVLAP